MTPFTLANLVLQQHNSQASVVNRHLCPTALRKTCGGDDALKFIGRRREPAWIDNGRLRNFFSLAPCDRQSALNDGRTGYFLRPAPRPPRWCLEIKAALSANC